MHVIDWLVIVAYLVWIVYDGLKRTTVGRRDGRLPAGQAEPAVVGGRPLGDGHAVERRSRWSGTTGQGYADGMRFVQFYFGLPIAMIILSRHGGAVLLPRAGLHRLRVSSSTGSTRRRAASPRCCSSPRAASRAASSSPAAVILSIVLGWNLTLTVLAIGVPTVVYTMVGGVQAVAWTDVKQMAVIVFGVLAAVGRAASLGLPDDVSLGQALHVAGAAGRLQDARLLVQPHGEVHRLVGHHRGLFLMLAYFGCDQSQVQRVPHGEVDRRRPAARC